MFNRIPQITVDEVKNAVDKREDVILLDVRTPGEYSRGKIEGSVNIPVDSLGSTLASLLSDKSKNIFVYCLSGSRSDIAVHTMQQMGYVNVFSMTHGLLEWRMKKYPLI